MTNYSDCNQYLNSLSEEERQLVLAVDDAQDALFSYRLSKEYGVTVECNPNGDRNLIVIDGVTMNHHQFANWLNSKRLEKYGQASDEDEYDEDDEDDLFTMKF